MQALITTTRLFILFNLPFANMSKVATSVLTGAVVLYLLRKYDPEFLYDAQHQLRFGDNTVMLVSAAAAGAMYLKGPNILAKATGTEYTGQAGIFGPDMYGANMAQSFRGQAGVAGGIPGAMDLGSTFSQ
jgi:hypothetical protein